MPGILTSGRDTIMTNDACAIDLAMVDSDNRYPGGTVMARFTYIGRINMSCREIVTCRTHTIHLRMINGNDWYPRCTAMTSFTYIGGTDMRIILASGSGAIMTGCARAIDLAMIHRDYRYPLCS